MISQIQTPCLLTHFPMSLFVFVCFDSFAKRSATSSYCLIKGEAGVKTAPTGSAPRPGLVAEEQLRSLRQLTPPSSLNLTQAYQLFSNCNTTVSTLSMRRCDADETDSFRFALLHPCLALHCFTQLHAH